MESKDQILLLVPIIVNGIFLFVFQKIISGKFDRQEKKNELSLNVLGAFRAHVISSIQAMNNLQTTLNHGGDGSKEMEGYCKTVQELCNYYSVYKVVLSGYEKEMGELVNSLNSCISIIKNHKNKLKQNEMNFIINELNKNDEILQKICEKCFDLTI